MIAGRPEPRPNVAPSMRSRRHWMIAALAVAVIASGLLVARPWSQPGPAAPAVDALDGTVVVVGEVGRWLVSER